MGRAIVIMLDSFGVGQTQDAKKYGDAGADTLRHIAEYCAQGKADERGRTGALHIPNLIQLGLNHLAKISQGEWIASLPIVDSPSGAYGCAAEQSHGKDTQSGHWEMAGLPVLFEWGYFKSQDHCFPESLLTDLIREAKLPGVIGNCHASGTEIIQRLGELHQQTQKPIVYTSADSVFQIAAHQESFGLERLYHICEIARKLVDPYRIGRVIARPFSGTPGNYARTAYRRDYATPPHGETLLSKLKDLGREVITIGKVADIYAHVGVTQEIKAYGNRELFSTLIDSLKHAPDGSLLFVNLVDFDMLYGHRRDMLGYAKALEEFDTCLPELFKVMKLDDLAVITADHGCDPSFPGSDHTREHVPVLAFGAIAAGEVGLRSSFADIGQTLADHLNIPPLEYGISFLKSVAHPF